MCTKRTDLNPPKVQVASEILAPISSTTAPGLSDWLEAKLPAMLTVNLFEKKALNVFPWRDRESTQPKEMNLHTLFACLYR